MMRPRRWTMTKLVEMFRWDVQRLLIMFKVMVVLLPMVVVVVVVVLLLLVLLPPLVMVAVGLVADGHGSGPS